MNSEKPQSFKSRYTGENKPSNIWLHFLYINENY